MDRNNSFRTKKDRLMDEMAIEELAAAEKKFAIRYETGEFKTDSGEPFVVDPDDIVTDSDTTPNQIVYAKKTEEELIKMRIDRKEKKQIKEDVYFLKLEKKREKEKVIQDNLNNYEASLISVPDMPILTDTGKKKRHIKSTNSYMPRIIDLKSAREKVGMSQNVFGKYIGLNQSQISRWENSNYLPLDLAWRIEDMFGINLKDFRINGLTDMTEPLIDESDRTI